MGDADERASDGGRDEGVTRRRFLETTVLAGATAGVAPAVAAQAETYEFGGEVLAWQGQAPAAIEGEQNPTLQLQAGTEYRVVWENLDGQPHNFTIQDAGGAEIVSTDTMSNQGETLELTFTATPEMATYICTIHPTTMVGDLQVQGGAQANGGGGGGGLPLDTLLLVGTILMMFLSPIAFAVLLYVNRDRGERGAAASVDD